MTWLCSGVGPSFLRNPTTRQDERGASEGLGSTTATTAAAAATTTRILVSWCGGNGGDEFELRRQTKPIYLVST